MSTTVTVTCEQAVYGSFPFREQGYDFLTSSQGCRQEWLAAFARFCRDLGQPPGEAAPKVDRLIYARKIASGPWVVALGSAQGCDDRGRPGAWAFHGLFLSGRDFRKLGYSPFPLRPFLLEHFDSALSLTGGPITLRIEPESLTECLDPSMIRWISRGKLLRRASGLDTFESTRVFWNSLPERIRRKRSVTTWAFRSDTPFHWSCVATRTLADDPATFPANQWHFSPGEEAPGTSTRTGFARKVIVLSATGIFVISLLILAIRSALQSDRTIAPRIEDPREIVSSPPRTPADLDFRTTRLPTGTTGFIQEKLTDWAERLDSDVSPDKSDSLAQAHRIVRSIRYSGPLLPHDFEQNLVDEPRAKAARAYANTVRQHALIRDWPHDFVTNSDPMDPRMALAWMAWCIGADDLMAETVTIETRSQFEDWSEKFRQRVIPEAIPGDLPATGLENRYPELSEYRLHLSWLLRIR